MVAWGLAGVAPPTPVGALPRGDRGLLVDLAGKVWEWTKSLETDGDAGSPNRIRVRTRDPARVRLTSVRIPLPISPPLPDIAHHVLRAHRSRAGDHGEARSQEATVEVSLEIVANVPWQA